MGEVELDMINKRLIIHSHLIFYGNAVNGEVVEQMRDEIESMWNEPNAIVRLQQGSFAVRFQITAEINQELDQMEVLQNVDPRKNYFRIEEFAKGNISFVDGLGCNSGYFKLENLYKGSTTAAHEYGHTIGLDHPVHLDIRGEGVPGIMYPRGTLVDPQFQYDPTKPAGVTGGTMHPMYRKVRSKDIEDLKLNRLRFNNGSAILGDYSNVYHWPHDSN